MKTLFVMVTLLSSLTACANKPLAEGGLGLAPVKVVTPTGEQEVKLNDTHAPGKVRWVQFPWMKEWQGAELKCRQEVYKYHVEGEQAWAYIAETYWSELTPYACLLQLKGKELVRIDFVVKDYKFPEERLKVDFRKVKLSKKDQARALKEQRMLSKIYAQSSEKPYFTEPFKAPLQSHITSIYGTKRVYNNMHNSPHLGTDFRSAIGNPIPAANSGKIVFAGDLFYTGGTIIIDHGLDLFTIYAHLSELKVTAGQMVKQGDIVALSGNTGRSSGPHLHWGIKAHGQNVDPFSMVEETKRQFSTWKKK